MVTLYELRPILEQLESAVADRITVSVRYTKGEGDEPEERRLDHYGLLYRQNKWYVAAYCHLRQSIRVFRANAGAVVDGLNL